jgi:hypothetical protein
MPLSTTASLTGAIYYSNGQPYAGAKLIIKKIIDTNGNIISSDHTIYKSNQNGIFNIVVPKNSYVYIYGDAIGFNSYDMGTPFWVGNATNYTLSSITSNLDVPTVIPILSSITGGTGASTFVDLSDTPSAYTSAANKLVVVKADESGLEFIENTAITGSLSSYALLTELDKYSLTSHTHSSYALSSELSNYSLTSHTHSSYALSSDLDSYALTTSLSSYVESSDLDSYATTSSLSAYAETSDLDKYSLTSHAHTKSNITDFTETDYVHISGSETVLGDKIFQYPPKFVGGNNSAIFNTFFVHGSDSTTTALDTANIQTGIGYAQCDVGSINWTNSETTIIFENEYLYDVKIELIGIEISATGTGANYVKHVEQRIYNIISDTAYEIRRIPIMQYLNGVTFSLDWDTTSSLGLEFKITCTESLRWIAKIQIFKIIST